MSRYLEYISMDDYLANFVEGGGNVALIDSSTFLKLRADGENLIAGSIPTESGKPTSIVDGWMWVLTTSNTDQQVLAARLLSSMMESNQHQDYAATIQMLPSQRTVLLNMDDGNFDVTIMNDILLDARIPLFDNAEETLAHAIHDALITILSGDNTAEEAVQVVLNQMSN